MLDMKQCKNLASMGQETRVEKNYEYLSVGDFYFLPCWSYAKATWLNVVYRCHLYRGHPVSWINALFAGGGDPFWIPESLLSIVPSV